MKLKIFLIFFVTVISGTVIWYLIKSDWFLTHKQYGSIWCDDLGRIINSCDSNFNSIKGAQRDAPEEGDSCKLYDSKIHLPASTDNNIEICVNDLPSFMSTLYWGTDSIYAFNTYLDFVKEFLNCFPKWKYADKENYEKVDSEIYAVFTNANRVVYVTYSYDEEQKRYFSDLIITPDTSRSFK